MKLICVSQNMKGTFWQIQIIKFKCITTIKFSEINFCQKVPFINYITHILKIKQFYFYLQVYALKILI